MKLQSKSSVLNFGDTSFRQNGHNYLKKYRQILSILSKHMDKNDNIWDKKSQAEYYSTVLSETDLFQRHEEDIEKRAQRGRTLTNVLLKVGFIDSSRKITFVGKDWLDNNISMNDAFENLLNISSDNILFFRQWSKLRLYGTNKENYFHPFLFMLYILSKYDRIPKDQLLTIVHSINTDYDNDRLQEIVNAYELVSNGSISFDDYFIKYVDSDEENIDFTEVSDLLSEENVDEDKFGMYFPNRKSKKKVLLYKNFVENLIKFRRTPSNENMLNLINISKDSSIKKAFGFGKNPFLYKKTKSYGLNDFLRENKKSSLLSGDITNVYKTFKASKKYDLISEYSDMTRRLTSLSGVVSFDNGLVSLPLRSLFKVFFDKFSISLSGSGGYTEYEEEIDSPFFRDISFLNFLGISDSEIEKLINNREIESADDVRKKEYTRFKDMTERRFPKDKVVDLLSDFINRNDKKIQDEVTDSATVPDIFEYILGIAWYYISGDKVNILKAYNMSLDADFLPLGHAAGYQGDIELNYSDKTVLLEATLMTANVQKRGEMEPVIRHTTNLTIDNDVKTQTIFIANELDQNVLNIFKATSYTQLNHSNKDESCDGINIFAMSINELISVLSKNINDSKILSCINDDFDRAPTVVKNNWRESTIAKIIS